jgi:dienelactone hydrolase
MPERCDLSAREFGEFRGDGFRARKVAYRILPDCWATAAIFYPDPLTDTPLPAVLYACGHSNSGILGYQNHGALWARRGYICLVFDTIEQHDSPGDHHGTIQHGRFDWISMGYSAAGGELWNTIRALDLLAGLPEVDAARIGATGNSGGGGHSLFVGMADDRVRAVASACGVTVPFQTLRDRHLMDHCDCLYFPNPFRRDTSEFAALMAPRPLLYCFAAQDLLFSRDEYRGLLERTRRVYRLTPRIVVTCLSTRGRTGTGRRLCRLSAHGWTGTWLARNALALRSANRNTTTPW